MSEDEIQRRFVRLLDRLNATQSAGILFCSTQGGMRMRIGQARKMVEGGYRKGIPDLLIYTPSLGFCGLALELKTLKGRPSPEQLEWVRRLNSFGWSAHVVKGYDEAVEKLFQYFPELDEPTAH
jgi:hypothetical protein